MKEYSAEKNAVHWISTTNETGTDYGKYLLNDPETGIVVKEDIYPHQYRTIWHTHTCGHGIFLLDGELYTDVRTLKPGQFIWWPAGIHMEHGGTDTVDADILHMSDARFDLTLDPKPAMKPDSSDPSVVFADSNEMEWSERKTDGGQVYYEKVLVALPQISVSLLNLPCGFETGEMQWSSDHAFFVLKGIMKTQDGFYGPRSFVRDPKGMKHIWGAGKYAETTGVHIVWGPSEL